LPARNALALVSMLNITFIHYSITITFIAPRHFKAGGSFSILIFTFSISFHPIRPQFDFQRFHLIRNSFVNIRIIR